MTEIGEKLDKMEEAIKSRLFVKAAAKPTKSIIGFSTILPNVSWKCGRGSSTCRVKTARERMNLRWSFLICMTSSLIFAEQAFHGKVLCV